MPGHSSGDSGPPNPAPDESEAMNVLGELKYPPYSEDFYPENFDDTLHDTTSHEGEIDEAVRSMYESFVA